MPQLPSHASDRSQIGRMGRAKPPAPLCQVWCRSDANSRSQSVFGSRRPRYHVILGSRAWCMGMHAPLPLFPTLPHAQSIDATNSQIWVGSFQIWYGQDRHSPLSPCAKFGVDWLPIAASRTFRASTSPPFRATRCPILKLPAPLNSPSMYCLLYLPCHYVVALTE